MNDIILSDNRTKLLEEIMRLRTQLAALIQTREQLEYYICPQLEVRWVQEFGEMRNRIAYQQLSILELKRRIEIMRAALNREKTVSQEDVDQQVNEEYQDYEQKVDEEYQKAKEAEENQKQREADRRQYRNQWSQQFSTEGEGQESSERKDEDDGSDQQEKEYQADDPDGRDGSDENGYQDGGSSEGQGTDKNEKPTTAKSLFRSIVKRLHPDMNPNQTQHEKDLFNKAVEAYQNGDMVTLQNIYDEITVGKEDSGEANESYLSIEELIKIRDRLAKRIDELSSELDEIRSAEPYTYKEILDDPDRLAQAKAELEEDFKDNEAEIERLSQLLSEVEQEMEELKNKKGRK